jgi:hypothetical protein
MGLQPLWTLVAIFSFLIYTQSVGFLGRGIKPSQGSQGRYLNTGRHKQNKRTQTSMPLVGFEPITSVSEWAKTVHVLDRAATVIGKNYDHTSRNHTGLIF